MERRPDGYDLVSQLPDGKTFAEDEMVTAVSATITGERSSSASGRPRP
jgi:hypothetical protein